MRAMERCDTASSVVTVDTGGPPDHRRAPRYTLLIRTAKLICRQGEFLCIVRDASETGISARIFHPLPHAETDADTIVLELPNGDRHEMQQVWEEHNLAGFRFLHSANIARLVESPHKFSKRQLRINFPAPVTLLCGLPDDLETHDGVITNISQQGAQVFCDAHLSIDQRIRLRAKAMPEVTAKIRWRRDGAYGLIFEDIFQFGDFARIVANLQTAAA